MIELPRALNTKYSAAANARPSTLFCAAFASHCQMVAECSFSQQYGIRVDPTKKSGYGVFKNVHAYYYQVPCRLVTCLPIIQCETRYCFTLVSHIAYHYLTNQRALHSLTAFYRHRNIPKHLLNLI